MMLLTRQAVNDINEKIEIKIRFERFFSKAFKCLALRHE